MLPPKKKVILITGGATGLGHVIAEELCREHTVYCTSRDVKQEQEGGIRYVRMDITSESDVREAISQIRNKEGSIDVIINNAGVTLSGPTLDFSAEDFKMLLDTNVVGGFRILKEVFRHNEKPERVINITSLNGFFSFPNFGIYSASKFASEALGLALRYELGATTQVVNVSPGALLAESQKKMPHKTAREKIKILNWLMPLTTKEDVARVIAKLVRAKRVPAQVRIGRDAFIIHTLQRCLPGFMFDKIVFFVWRKH